MTDMEVLARQAAQRWQDRTSAKDELRLWINELLKDHTMSEIAEMIDIKRTTLYYFMYGRNGKRNS